MRREGQNTRRKGKTLTGEGQSLPGKQIIARERPIALREGLHLLGVDVVEAQHGGLLRTYPHGQLSHLLVIFRLT